MGGDPWTHAGPSHMPATPGLYCNTRKGFKRAVAQNLNPAGVIHNKAPGAVYSRNPGWEPGRTAAPGVAGHFQTVNSYCHGG